MMGKLNSASNHIILKIIFAVIILSFILGGVSSYLASSSDDYVAKVNGQKISRSSFEATVQQVINQENLGSLSEQEQAEQTKMLRMGVLNNQINGMVYDQYKQDQGITISDNMVKQNIMNVPNFQKDGKFDNETFLALLKANNLTPDNYAEMLRRSLASDQIYKGLIATDFVLPNDSNVSILRAQKRNIYLATLESHFSLKDDDISEEEIKSYYLAHQQAFSHPEQVKANFVHVPLSSLEKRVVVSEKDERAYYAKNKDKFMAPARKFYSMISVDNQKEAESILADLKKGADFAKLSQQKSMTPYLREKKGQIDWFTADQEPPEISSANLSKIGQFSNVITLKDGHEYAIFKLDKIEKTRLHSFDDVKENIHTTLMNQQVVQLSQEIQTKLQGAISQHQSLSDLAKIADVNVDKTNWFSFDRMPYGFDDDSVKQAVFSSGLFDESGPIDTTSDVVASNNGIFVFQVIAHRLEGVSPLDEVSGNIINQLKHTKGNEYINQKAQEILAELNKGDTAILQKYNMSFAKKYTVTLNEQDKVFLPGFVDAVFDAPESHNGKASYGYVVSPDNTQAQFFVITSVDKDPTAKSDLSTELMARWDNIGQQMLMGQLRENASIKLGQVN